MERHSCELRRPETLEDQRVAIVGEGTSAWDLLELAIRHGAAEIHWVHRSTKWCLPTGAPKQRAWPNLRELAVIQSLAGSVDSVNAFLRGLLRIKYWFRGMTALRPEEPFDVREHQLIPARSTMIQNLDTIVEHRSEVRSVKGNTIRLEDGEHFEANVLLWGTGYRMNLAFLDLPPFLDMRRLDELTPRLGSLVRSVDYPALFFLGISLTESTSSTPFIAALETRTIISHILGECEIPKTPVPHQITHWNLHRLFASFDHANYSKVWWRVKYFFLALWYLVLRGRTIRV